MLKVGLTGGIGSGKSVVAKVFEKLGVKIYYADIEAKKFLFSEDILRKLKNRFGDKAVVDSKPNTKFIASIVFNDDKELDWLNNQIHPLVAEDFENWAIKNSSEDYIIHEAAIIFESGFFKNFDKIITVSANVDERIHRVIKRDNVDVEDVLNRMTKQYSDSQREQLSDYVIFNNDKDAILDKILKIHFELKCL